MESEVETKSDYADIPIKVWYQRFFMHFPHVQYFTQKTKINALENIRNLALCYWRFLVIKSFICHMIEIYGKSWETKLRIIRVKDQSKDFWKDIHVGIYLVMRCSIASWWEWLVGSTLFFWRWTNNHKNQARDSGNAWIYGNLTRFGKPWYLSKKSYLTLINKKVGKVRERWYTSKGQVRILTRFFGVPKGKTDIRVVYYGTVHN